MTESLENKRIVSAIVRSEIAVVIPYFQRERGILRRGLRSVFQQRDAPPANVIIIDDGSPTSVETEIERFSAEMRARITVIRQSNQGPGPARNTGLAAVPESVRWIAFLDSDDIWHELHLSRAVQLLERGFDFFYADGDVEGEAGSLFRTLKFDGTGHTPVGDQSLFAFQGDFTATLLKCTPVVTSTVVLRKTRLGTFRFPSSPGTCEDLLYWLDIASAHPRVGFSVEIEATGGRAGVHISHRGDWRSNGSLRCIADFDRYYRSILGTIPMSSEQRELVRNRYLSNRQSFLITTLALLKVGKCPDLSTAFEFLVRNPLATLHRAKSVRT